MSKDDYAALSKRFAYQFRDPALLRAALTHRSAGKRNNERLEFLGDGILNFVIASALFERFPKATEGQLSRLRASLVRGEKLAELAAGLGLGDYLTLGSGELKSGGFRRSSILADALEAVFGAVYLDGGYDAVRTLILAVYADALNEVDCRGSLKDPKTRLQEWLQSRKLPLPNYEVIEVVGEPHKQHFTVTCVLSEPDRRARGEGSSRRKAEQMAAARLLEELLQ